MKAGIWRPAPPAERAVLIALSEQANWQLPRGYLDQLAVSNGGEGDLGVEQPGWISIWPAEQVLELNREYHIHEDLPGFFGFASNGGGELLAFDTRAGEPFPIVMVPFIQMDAREAVRIAKSFEELRGLIGREPNAAV
jgi:hypothetical protein